jgi:hypothetical protein
MTAGFFSQRREDRSMTEPTFGVVFNRVDDDPRPVIAFDLSVAALVLPTDDADAIAFPLNSPVDMNSSDGALLGKLGDGDLPKAIELIDAQLGDFQSAARLVVVRVAKGATDAETIANIVGSPSATAGDGQIGTGLHALKRAGVQLGVIPRLIGTPGYTHQRDTGGAQSSANAICAALPSICSALLAHAVVSSDGGDLTEITDWRETLNSGRLIPNADWVKVMDGTVEEERDGAAAAIGAMIRTDFQHRGYPFWTAANQPIYGVTGLKKYRPFSLTDGATEGQEALATRMGIFQRGQIGVETAAADSGFVWDGVYNADVDPLWWFYNKSRGRDWAHLALLKSIRRRIGKQNVGVRSVEQVLEDAIVIGTEMVQNGGSLGLKVSFDGPTNSVENLRLGKFRISFANEEPPPIMQVGVDSKPYRKAMEITLQNIIAQSQAMLPIYAP